jgi:urea transport system permease protein
MGNLGNPAAIHWLEEALGSEPNRWVQHTIAESIQLLKLSQDHPDMRLAAVQQLGELRAVRALSTLRELSQIAPGADKMDPALHTAVMTAIEQIEAWRTLTEVIETVFRGISLSSVLLLMALGLAVIFGLMGIINMAHGELMMLGAYATFVVQESFRAYLPAPLFDYYFLLALPVSFIVAGLCGLLLEASLIRFLYGRPLETLLATWGVSLILIQAARKTFGDLTSVVSPRWLSGGVEILVGVQLPYNRLFILGIASACVAGMYLVLFRTSLGLKVRAVTQNRDMSACLGVSTRRVDAGAFALGAGLAGVAGCALTQIGNVDPGLGQNYIVDSFLVVVTGGVGKLAGTIAAAFGIGGLNKILEPSLGAIYAKILLLLLVIAFLQRRPSGLFVTKGRGAES